VSQYTPKSKSVATVTARKLRANAADMRNYAAALDRSADLYMEGNYAAAHNYADHVYSALLHFCREWLKLRLKHLRVYRTYWPSWMRKHNGEAHLAWRKRQIERAHSFEPLDRAP
jgi:hypothetical protein